MNELGFSFPTRDYVRVHSALPEDRPFGVADEAEARKRGYHGVSAGPVVDMVGDFLAGMSTAEQMEWRKAYAGDDGVGGGCLQRALDTVYGDFSDYDAARVQVEDLVNQATVSAMADARVSSAIDRWRSCMRAHGYDFGTPAAAAEAGLAGGAFEEPPSPPEIRQALVDVGCKTDSNLMSEWFIVKAAVERDLVERNAELVRLFAAYREREGSSPLDSIAT